MRTSGERELSIADGAYAAVMKLEATDQHLLRVLLPSLMVKVASVFFDEELSEESMAWLDMRDKESKPESIKKEKPPLTPKMITKIVESVLVDSETDSEDSGADIKAREGKYGPVLRSIAPQMYDAINEK